MVTMARHDDYDDESPFGPDGLLKDGRRWRVPMMMRDSMSDVQRSVMEDKMSRFNDSAARHGPGPVYDAAGLERKARAYADSVRELTEAWRNAPPSVSDAWKMNNMSNREVARLHDTGDAKRDAYLDQKYD